MRTQLPKLRKSSLFVRIAVLFAAAPLLAGCGTVDRVADWWKGEPTLAPRFPPGTVEYACEGNKIFHARFEDGGRVAWVKFPDREFRLDAIPGAVAGRYGNGRTTLNTKADEAFLTEGTVVIFANCKRVAAD